MARRMRADAILRPRPMELLLAGTGGCTAFDIVLILKRGRHQRQRLAK
jgi:putative redox protein